MRGGDVEQRCNHEETGPEGRGCIRRRRCDQRGQFTLHQPGEDGGHRAPVGQHDSLRMAGRARGIHDGHIVICIKGLRRPVQVRSGGLEGVERRREFGAVAHADQVQPQRFDQRRHATDALAIGKDQLCRAVLQRIIQLGRCPPAVQKDRHGAHGADGHEEDQQLGAVAHGDADRLALGDSDLLQGVGDAAHVIAEGRVTPALVVENQIVVKPGLRRFRPLQQRARRAGNIGEGLVALSANVGFGHRVKRIGCGDMRHGLRQRHAGQRGKPRTCPYIGPKRLAIDDPPSAARPVRPATLPAENVRTDCRGCQCRLSEYVSAYRILT